MGSDTIGHRLRELREAKGVTQAQVGKDLHVDRTTVNNWETNTRDLKTEYTVKLADYYGTTCDYILRGVHPENVTIHSDLNLTDIAIGRLKWFGLGDITSFLLEHEPLLGLARKYLESDFEPIWTNDLKEMASSEAIDIAASVNVGLSIRESISESIIVRNKKRDGQLTTFPISIMPEIFLLEIQAELRRLRVIYQNEMKEQQNSTGI